MISSSSNRLTITLTFARTLTQLPNEVYHSQKSHHFSFHCTTPARNSFPGLVRSDVFHCFTSFTRSSSHRLVGVRLGIVGDEGSGRSARRDAVRQAHGLCAYQFPYFNDPILLNYQPKSTMSVCQFQASFLRVGSTRVECSSHHKVSFNSRGTLSRAFVPAVYAGGAVFGARQPTRAASDTMLVNCENSFSRILEISPTTKG